MILLLLSNQRIEIKARCFLEPVDVLRKKFLCQKIFLNSIFFCLETTRRVSPYSSEHEMNLTLSFLLQSDKLVIGPHLLLSCKYSGEESRAQICWSSKSDSGGDVAMLSTYERSADVSVSGYVRPCPAVSGRVRPCPAVNALSRIVSRSCTRSVGEQRLDTKVFLFCKIFGLITCEGAHISQKADTRLLWIVAGIDLARIESRRSWGRSCRRIGRSPAARWEGAGQHWCNVRHVARSMTCFGECTQLHLEPCKCMESEWWMTTWQYYLTDCAHEKNACDKVFCVQRETRNDMNCGFTWRATKQK